MWLWCCIIPHTGDLFIESCRCGYVVLHSPPTGDLFIEWVCSGIGVASGDLFGCRCGYVVALVFISPHTGDLCIESCRCGIGVA